MTELSDELLVAYVDGQLARDQTRAVDKVLEQDEVVARRVDTLKEAHGRLESAFEAILAGELSEIMASAPSAPRPVSKPSSNGLAKVGLATAGVGIALGALVAGYGWPLVIPDLTTLGYRAPPQQQSPPVAVAALQQDQKPQNVVAPPSQPKPQILAPPPTWQEEALRAHALLSRASVEISLESQGNHDLVAFQIAQAIGPAVKLPDFEAQGLKFMRGQLLHYGDKPLAQMLYLGAHKDPLALYAMRGGGGNSRPVFAQKGATGSVSWRDDGIAYLLAGEEDEATLYRLAEKVRNEPSALEIVPPVPPKPEPQLSQAPAEPAAPSGTSASPPTASDPSATGSNPLAPTSPPTASDPLTTGSTASVQQAVPEPAQGPLPSPTPAPAPGN